MAKENIKAIKHIGIIIFLSILALITTEIEKINSFLYRNLDYKKYDLKIHAKYIFENISIKEPLWIVVGGSSARESFYKNFDSTIYFQNKCKKKLNFLNLGSSDQSLFESTKIINNAKKKYDLKKVFFQINVNRLLRDPFIDRIFLDSSEIEAIFKNKKISNVLKNFNEFYYVLDTKALFSNKTKSKLPSNRNKTYSGLNQKSLNKINSQIMKRRIRQETVKSNIEINLQLIDKINNFFKKKKIEIFFIITPEFQSTINDPQYIKFNRQVKEYFRKKYKNNFLDYSEIKIQNKYFYDVIHLNNQGTRIFKKYFFMNDINKEKICS